MNVILEVLNEIVSFERFEFVEVGENVEEYYICFE